MVLLGHFVGELTHGAAMAVFHFDEVTGCAVVVTHQRFAVECLLKLGAAGVLDVDGLQAQAGIAGSSVRWQQSFVDVMQTEPAAQAVNDGGELARPCGKFLASLDVARSKRCMRPNTSANPTYARTAGFCNSRHSPTRMRLKVLSFLLPASNMAMTLQV